MLHLYLGMVSGSITDTVKTIEYAQKVYLPEESADAFESLESVLWEYMRSFDELPDFNAMYVYAVNMIGAKLIERIIPDANITFDSDIYVGDITIDSFEALEVAIYAERDRMAGSQPVKPSLEHKTRLLGKKTGFLLPKIWHWRPIFSTGDWRWHERWLGWW